VFEFIKWIGYGILAILLFGLIVGIGGILSVIGAFGGVILIGAVILGVLITFIKELFESGSGK
jgi:hypothetical protein